MFKSTHVDHTLYGIFMFVKLWAVYSVMSSHVGRTFYRMFMLPKLSLDSMEPRSCGPHFVQGAPVIKTFREFIQPCVLAVY
jgi:hypothetical protein